MARKSVIVRGKYKQRARKTCTDKYKLPNPAYWEARLKRMGLTMDAGRVNWIDYGHAVTALDYDGRVAFVPPTGESSDALEWPMSL